MGSKMNPTMIGHGFKVKRFPKPREIILFHHFPVGEISTARAKMNMMEYKNNVDNQCMDYKYAKIINILAPYGNRNGDNIKIEVLNIDSIPNSNKTHQLVKNMEQYQEKCLLKI